MIRVVRVARGTIRRTLNAARRAGQLDAGLPSTRSYDSALDRRAPGGTPDDVPRWSTARGRQELLDLQARASRDRDGG